MHDREHVAADKISVIYNGYIDPSANVSVSDSDRDVLDFPAGSRIIGVVANVKPIKRLDTLITGFAQIASQYPYIILVIVVNDSPPRTGGSMMVKLRELAERKRIGGRVVFTGGVDNPSEYVRRFDVAVLCSESEGFSNAIIEYMAEACPVVCTDVGGKPELVRHGVSGYLIPVGDSAALASRLSELLSDTALARRMGEAGREIIRSSYTHTRMVEAQMACYDEILAEHQDSRASLPSDYNPPAFRVRPGLKQCAG